MMSWKAERGTRTASQRPRMTRARTWTRTTTVTHPPLSLRHRLHRLRSNVLHAIFNITIYSPAIYIYSCHYIRRTADSTAPRYREPGCASSPIAARLWTAMRRLWGAMVLHVTTTKRYQALAGRQSRTTIRGLVDEGIKAIMTLERDIVKSLFADAVPPVAHFKLEPGYNLATAHSLRLRLARFGTRFG